MTKHARRIVRAISKAFASFASYFTCQGKQLQKYKYILSVDQRLRFIIEEATILVQLHS